MRISEELTSNFSSIQKVEFLEPISNLESAELAKVGKWKGCLAKDSNLNSFSSTIVFLFRRGQISVTLFQR